jgi:hypothetical protein
MCSGRFADSASRPKIKRILKKKLELASLIQSCCRTDDKGTSIWTPEDHRVQNIVIKLARGHAAFELSVPELDHPDEVHIVPLITMSAADRDGFENAGTSKRRVWPELGSRAFLRACGAFADQAGPWIVVQPNRYRYTVDQYGGVRVQIVIAEYLACVVDWRAP